MIEIPWQSLTPEALYGLMEEFVTREGTEYGESEVPLATKVAQVRRQLERGEAVIVFDPVTETTNLLSLAQWREIEPSGSD